MAAGARRILAPPMRLSECVAGTGTPREKGSGGQSRQKNSQSQAGASRMTSSAALITYITE